MTDIKERQQKQMLAFMDEQKYDDETRKRALKSMEQIHEDPHICNECWSGGSYLDGKLICECLPENVLDRIDAGIGNGVIIKESDDGNITHWKMITRFYAVYDHPKDFPEHWVVRGWEIRGELYEPQPDAEPILLTTLTAAHIAIKRLAPAARLIDREDPDPNIAEVWAER